MNRVARCGLLLALAALPCLASAASPRDELLARAKLGDAAAMRELASDYHLGRHGRANRAKAVRWARAAIDRNDVAAELVLAEVLSDGDRGRLGGAACFWYLSAMHQELRGAELPAADCLASGSGRTETVAEARRLYELALAAGHAEARMRLYHLYASQRGRGTPAQRAEREALARRYLREAAAAGDLEGMWMLATLLRDAKPPEQDLAQSVEWFGRAADGGHLGSTVALGVLLYDEPRVADPARAVALFRVAAERGDATAMRYLGRAHATGRGATLDQQAAQRWYLAAGRRKDGEAAMQRALHHLDPDSGAFSYQRARYWLRIASRQGQAAADRRLGIMYLRGEGVEPNLRRGLELLESAALQQDLDAAREMIRIRLEGKVVDPDLRRATNIAEQNVEKLDAASCARIGRAYLEGGPQVHDTQVARTWLRRAAERGHAPSMATLAVLLADGRGGPPDASAAAAWRAKAVAAGVAVPAAEGPPAIDRAAARAAGATLANLRWRADLDWGARDALVVHDLPARGAVRSEFRVFGNQPQLQLTGTTGIELAYGVEQTLGVYLRLLPLANLGSRREVTQSELVIEERAGAELTRRTVIATGPWHTRWRWAEVAWDDAGVVTVRVDDHAVQRIDAGPFRFREVRAVIDSVAAEFRYLAVD